MKFSKNKKNKKWLIYFILAGFIIKLLTFVFNRKNRKKLQVNFKDFINDEKDEVEELVEGKQGLKKFCCDSGSIFKEYFIPHDGNEHKPKILRTKSLAVIVVGMILIKAAVTGYLFFIYPNQARMTEIITKQILELINNDRNSNGMQELSINPALTEAALIKAQNMLDYDYFAHKSLNGKMPWDWIDRGEYAYLFVGENLAMNFSSAQAAHNALMQSETHKKNILNQKYADIGLAVLSGELDGKQTNVLVQMFGSSDVGCRMSDVGSDKQQTEDPSASSGQDQQQTTNDNLPPTAVLPANPTVPDEPVESKPVSESADLNIEEQQVEPTESASLQAESGKEKKIEIKPIEKKETAVAAVSSVTSKDIYVSPNKPIENNEITQVMSFAVQEDEKITMAAKMLQISQYIFLAVLAVIAIALLINIFVRISVQHKSVIVQSLLVIVFIVSLIYVRVHFLENFLEKVAVL